MYKYMQLKHNVKYVYTCNGGFVGVYNVGMELTITVLLATSCHRWYGIEMYSARVYLKVCGDNTIRVVYIYACMYTKTSYG